MNLNQIFTSLSTLKQEISVLTDATDINRHYVSLRELKQSLESISASVDINQQRPCFALVNECFSILKSKLATKSKLHIINGFIFHCVLVRTTLNGK